MKWQKIKLLESNLIAEDFRSMVYKIDSIEGFKAGQYCNLRITKPDGETIQRSYSIASAPVGTVGTIEFGIQIVPDGRATSYFDKMNVGDEIEMLGPLGHAFNWDQSIDRPLLLIGGGSGIVPLVSILRENIALGLKNKIFFLFSFKKLELLPWKEELLEMMDKENINGIVQLTQDWPDSWEESQRGRVTKEILTAGISKNLGEIKPISYICGSNSFVESIEGFLEEFGFYKEDIKTERYS